MKTLMMIFLLVVGFCATSCVESASPDELKQMCGNLVKLRGKIDTPSVKDLVAKAEADFKKEEERLTQWMERDLKSYDDELEVKLAALTTDEEKDALKKEFEAQKKVTREKHQPGIDELKPKKAVAVKEAKAKAGEAQAEWDEAVNECLADAEKEGTSKPVATCRIAATSADQYWNKCR